MNYSLKNSRQVAAIFLRAIRGFSRDGECRKARVMTEVLELDTDVRRNPGVQARALVAAGRIVRKCKVK